MRIIFSSIVISTVLLASCKQKGAVSTDQNTSTSTIMGNTKGEVSHEYRATGCATVIVVANEDGSSMTLIPKDKLDSKFDKNGLKINFNYHPLKMPNPAGCSVGIPAEITDISLQ